MSRDDRSRCRRGRAPAVTIVSNCVEAGSAALIQIGVAEWIGRMEKFASASRRGPVHARLPAEARCPRSQAAHQTGMRAMTGADCDQKGKGQGCVSGK